MSVWRAHLLRIGDRCPEYGLGNVDFKEHIDACCSVVFRELEHSGDDILKFLLQCAEQLPHKIPLYGVVIGLINLENEDFVKRILEITQINLQEAISSEKCDQIRVLIRFLTALMCSKVISPGSLVNLFETLLSSACTIVDEEKGNPSWQPRADFYVFCILSSLPWGGAELNEQIPEMIEEVMLGIQSYLSIRKHVHDTGVTFFEIGEGNDKTLDEKDFLEDLWVRVQSMSNDGWKVDSVPRPHLTFEAQLVGGKSHGIGPISCHEPPVLPSLGIDGGKQKHEAELRYPQRLRRLNIFPASKSENMQPIDRFVVEEYLLDVLLFFNGCRKECALYMASLPVPFRYEYLMAETIFSQLLLLPRAPFKPIYYTLVIIDLCKALPGAFPAVVAGAVRALFDRIADLDMECRTRLILWFSHHLANFQFTWPWEEWAYVVDLPKWAPKRVFVQEVLEREVRLSYWEKIKQSIENAVGLDELLPLKGGSNFKYRAEDGQESSPQHALSKDLNSMVKGKVTVHEIVLWVEEKVVAVHGFKCALEVVIQTLLDIGSKSFTHLITVMERYGNVIAKMCPDQEKQVMLIDEVSSYWKDNTQMTAIAIDRMMGYRLVSNLAIVYWVFSPSSMQQFHTSDRPWEILRNAISKTYNRISDLRKEIYSLKRSVLAAKESLVEAEAELEAAESKLSIVNGEPVRGENPGRLKRLKAFADKRKEEEVSTRESVEAKEALLARALEENKALFITMYKSFANVLMEGLSHADVDGKKDNVPSRNADAMAVDPDEPLTMEVDEENERSKKIEPQNGYTIEEEVQWRRSTLAYVKAFTRQYASEIWPHINELDSDVIGQDVDPQFQNAVYTGLGRPTPES